MPEMRPARLVFFLLLCALPLAAQTDIAIFAAHGTASSTSTPGGKIHFDSGRGFGVSATRFRSDHLALEFSASEIRYNGSVEFNAQESLDLGKLRIRPLALALQWHMAREERFDPYLGAGVAYVMASNLSSSALDSSGIGTVEVKSGFAPVANAGVNVSVSGSVMIAIDAKYMNFRPDSGPPNARQRLDVKPVIAAAGVRWRF